MKVQIMRLAKAGEEGFVVPDFEVENVWFICLTSAEMEIEVAETEEGEFVLRARDADISVLPRADNTIHVVRRPR